MSKKDKGTKNFAAGLELGLKMGRSAAPPTPPPPPAPVVPAAPPPVVVPPPAPRPKHREVHAQLKQTDPWNAAHYLLKHSHELDVEVAEATL